MGEASQEPIPELTVSERILIHLFDHNRGADDYTRPIAVTQEGIAAAISARRSHVSYCLKEMDERSFISERLKHIEGGTRRRKAYSLTPEGVNNAMDLRRSLLDLILPTPAGESTLGELLKRDDVKSTMTEIIRQVRESGTFDPEARQSGVDPGKKETRNVFFAGDVEGCPDFTGRKNEIETIIEWLSSSKGRIYVVHGMAGIGKTSLGYQVARRARSERNVFWHTCEEWTTSRSVAVSLGEFLERMGDGALNNHLKDRLQLDLVEVLHMLESGCRRSKNLLVLDDVQKATHELKQMIRMLVRLTEGEQDVKLLVLSRTMPSIYRTRDAMIGKTVLEVQLEGLSWEDFTSLLEKWGMGGDSTDGSTVEKIYRVTKGHPLAMELVRNRPVEEDGLRDITRFFRDEVLRNLSREEEEMLSLASLFRASAPDRGLFLQGGHYRTLDSLTERSLLKETRDGYVLHDVLREVMQGRLSVRRKEEIHRLIGVFFVSEARAGHARSALLSCHHFMEASELGATADALLQYGVTLLNEGYLEETLRCIGELLVRDTKMGDILPAKKRDALTCLLGNLLTFTGKIEEAKELLTELGGRLECGGDAGLVHAKVHNGLGIIAYREGLRDTAIEHYERAMGMARACREKEFVAKVLSNLGVLYWEGNEGEKARAAHLEAMELCWGLDDREGVARAYNNIGIISFKEGKPEEAARMFHKGLSISRKTGSMRIAAVALNNLGDAHREMGEAVKARDFYQKGLELARKHDFKRHQAVALKALAGMSRGSERAEYEEMAEELFSVLGMGPGDIDES